MLEAMQRCLANQVHSAQVRLATVVWLETDFSDLQDAEELLNIIGLLEKIQEPFLL